MSSFALQNALKAMQQQINALEARIKTLEAEKEARRPVLTLPKKAEGLPMDAQRKASNG